MTKPVVMKIGGSLEMRLDPILKALRRSNFPVLIVPGGGRFARLVRDSEVPEEEAHWMAVAAMEQYGWLIASRGVRHTSVIHRPEDLEVLLPYIPIRSADPLPHSWNITSDSLSGWIADQLGVDLILLKSVDGIFSEGRLQKEITDVVPTEDVDPFFLSFVLSKNVRTKVINGRFPGRLESFLSGHPVEGTTIGF